MGDAHVIRPRPPFSFDQALAFLRRFPPTHGDRAIVGDAVLGAARVAGQTFGIRVESTGDVERPALRCTFSAGGWVETSGPVGADDAEDVAAASAQGDGPERSLGPAAVLGPAIIETALGRIGDWLGADDDLGPFYALAEADPPFQAVVQRLYGYHQVRFFTPFENACWAILGQRTPIAAARAAKRRLVERFGGIVEIEGQTVLAFPEPEDLAGGSSQEVAGLVGSERKADRLLAIARAFAAVDPAALRAMPTDELGRWLQDLPGIGPWSVSFILLRGFGRADVTLPLGTTETFDRELLQAGRAVYGADLTAGDLARIAERYGPHRGSWGHYLRVAG